MKIYKNSFSLAVGAPWYADEIGSYAKILWILDQKGEKNQTEIIAHQPSFFDKPTFWRKSR